uniref:Uncharacterized protein n=1 Tax=Heterorhabditis bacteriophora TaxID=37862 RepID=A0A1I7WIJ7_HETBA
MKNFLTIATLEQLYNLVSSTFFLNILIRQFLFIRTSHICRSNLEPSV